MASESPSSTPMILTPDSTGSLEMQPQAQTDISVKRARRQTAFYPNVNSSNKTLKPFSRSAAKRESVMMLGSIEHLQHYFTKTGIAAKSNPRKPHSGLVPAIGGASPVPARPSLGSLPEFELPPSPAIPQSSLQVYPPYVKTYETDPEALLPGVIEDLIQMTKAWGLYDSVPSGSAHDNGLLSPPGTPYSGNLDVLETLKLTTRAIRSVRNYVFSLPDESAGTLRAQYRSTIAAGAPLPMRLASQSKSQPDPLTLIRRAALELLSILRDLEAASRLPLFDEAYDAHSDHESSAGQSQSPIPRSSSPVVDPDDSRDLHNIDPEMSISYVRVGGRHESVPVWEDEEGDWHQLSEEEQEKRELWDERLVLGGGWLYKQDVRLKDLHKEQETVHRYISVVDDVLFCGVKEGKRGWEREQERLAKRTRDSRSKMRRVSAGATEGSVFRFPSETSRNTRRIVSAGVLDQLGHMSLSEESQEMGTLTEEAEDEAEESFDEEDLPEWAKRDNFVDDRLGRANALLRVFLPDALLKSIQPSSDREQFLQSLSSGQHLCIAYNGGVRRSRKPWGFISADSIHDIIALEHAVEYNEDKMKRAWTFRRTDNLRLWAGALKLRYMIPVVSPSAVPLSELKTPQSSSLVSPSKPHSAAAELPLLFDPRAIARKEEGWMEMMEEAILRWTAAVVEERRGER